MVMRPQRVFIAFAAVAFALVAVGCSTPTATGRSPLPAPALGSPGAPGTSRADLDRTINEMETRLQSTPGDTAAGIRLAEALLRKARVVTHSAPAVQAERVLRKILASKAGDQSLYGYQAHRLLAAVLASQHRFQEAIVEAERCLQERRDDAVLYGIIGDAKLELGDREAATAAFDRMVQLRPDEASYSRVSYARELAGDRDGAVRLMAMALEATSPNDVESLAWHRSQLGALHFSAGRMADAAREFAHAVFLFPDYPLAVEGQALLRALGRSAEAAKRTALAEAVRATEQAR